MKMAALPEGMRIPDSHLAKLLPSTTTASIICEDAREAQALWRRARGMLQEREKKVQMDSSTTEYLQAAFTALKELPWKGVVKGFREKEEVETLARWLTTDWLTTTHEHQMLETLADDLALDESSPDTIPITFFAHTLSRGFYNPEAYRTGREWRWVRRLGDAFATGQRKRFGTIANINENHWVAIAFNCEEKVIYYGDPMGGASTEARTRPLQLVDLRASRRGILLEGFANAAAARSSFLRDSCLLRSRALLRPEYFPLPVPTLDSMANERLKMFILRHHATTLGITTIRI
ncbi:hypothetical protein B0H14DRAFT_2612956 [Mycena olivaceomarginata]|nr:hypothetical protein B0H14DRAFT_2612956 [Mycena olivaceomarginata]